MTNDITIFRMEFCPRCETLAELLRQQNVQFTERMMDDSESIAELLSNSIFTMTSPILKIDDAYFTDTQIFTNNYTGDRLSPAILDKLISAP